jgi:general stress protein YciG
MAENARNQDARQGSEMDQQGNYGFDSRQRNMEEQRQEVSTKEEANSDEGNDMNGTQDAPRKSSGRGFASMNPAAQREIASKGGKAAHQQGVAHEWTSEQAREAGRKGGQASSGGGRQSNRNKQNNP